MSRKPNPVPFPDHANPEKAQARTNLATLRQVENQPDPVYVKGSNVVHDMCCKCGDCDTYRELLANEQWPQSFEELGE